MWQMICHATIKLLRFNFSYSNYNMKHEESIIKKYGSVEAYYKQRNEKLRQTALNRCKTEEERQAKLREFEWKDFLMSKKDPQKIGKQCTCEECGDNFTANTHQTTYCNKCILKLGRIRIHGSLENYYKISDEHNKKTKLERYGSATFNNRESAKQTCLERYGVDNASKNKDVILKSNATKRKRYGEHLEKTIEKTRKTNLEKYGVECTLSDKNIWQKTLDTKRQLYGEHLEQFVVKSKQTKYTRYGNANYVNSEKAVETKRQKYGASAFFNSEKTKQTCLERYGVEYFINSDEFRKSCTREYQYKNMYFDSSWELYVWVYCELKNIPIKREPTALTYIFNEKEHKYYPDFEINNKLVEVKGDYFFENGKMICPFDRSSDDIYNAKYLCGLANNVEFWTSSKLLPIIEYVDNIYTKNFIKLFDVNLNFPYPNENLSSKDDLNIIRYFHKSIYDASYKKYLSPKEAWKDKNLILKSALNRLKYVKSCTPADILQGFNVAKIAPKVSVFRPKLAEKLIAAYLNDYNQIFDPFSGFSGRMIGAMNSSKQYIGQDINKDHVRESNEIIQYKNYVNCQVVQQDILTDSNKSYECLFTCPPYGNKEHWNENEVEKSCDEWIDICLEKYKCKKYLFVVDKTDKYKDYIVETIENKSHFGMNYEKVVLINKE